MHVPANRSDTQIFVRIAALCLGINIVGFGLNAALGRVDSAALSPILYIHALLFVAWSVLAVVQPSLVARANRMTHRKLGWTMMILAVAMGVSGLWITTAAISAGRMAPANIFMMINILTVAGFLGLIAAALGFRRKMAWHSRLMTSATILLTGPAWARILPMDLLGPAGLIAISACVLALSAWGMIHDRRAHGRIHPAWWWGASIATLIGPLAPPLAFIPSFADWAARI